MTNKNKKVIHNVHILDASGSMQGAKYSNALEGINSEIERLKKDKNTSYTETVVEFDSVEHGTERITEHYFLDSMNKCSAVEGRGASGNTPLYQTVGYILEKLLRKVNSGDQVIVTIFTDGQHNCNWGRYSDRKTLEELINDVQEHHNFTVTFSGTEEDTNRVIRDLGIKKGNTYIHQNTPESINAFYMARTSSLMDYTSSGNLTTETFFKNANNTVTKQD